MSAIHTNHNDDIQRLVNEGYEVELREGHIILHNIPYVTATKRIKLGKLVCPGNRGGTPNNHVMLWSGEYPCDQHGKSIPSIEHSSRNNMLFANLQINHSFSNKPVGQSNFNNFYEKFFSYLSIISHPAMFLDESKTPKTFKPIVESEDEVFHYSDTNASRANVTNLANKLRGLKIAIIGLGGTGSYILDMVAKTPVKEIHLIDKDVFVQHNSFRAPGAASLEELIEKPKKVQYFAKIYSKMRKGIVPHEELIHQGNFDMLKGLDFVFISIDKCEVKEELMQFLQAYNIQFIDVGLDVVLGKEDGLVGALRTTTSTHAMHDHIYSKQRVSFVDDDNNDLYKQNIQIAELNALNACLAVIKWKKIYGVYMDADKECHSIFNIDSNKTFNDDLAA